MSDYGLQAEQEMWEEIVSNDPTNTALVRGARSSREVAAYLPSNYRVTGEETDEHGRIIVRIAGTDTAGWTLDGYVIPRLASGLMFAEHTS